MTTAIITKLNLSKFKIINKLKNASSETETNRYKSLIGDTWKNIIHDIKKIRKDNHKIDDFNYIERIIILILQLTTPICFILSGIIIFKASNEIIEGIMKGFILSYLITAAYGGFGIKILEKIRDNNFMSIQFNQKNFTIFQKILLKINEWLFKDKEIIKQHKFNYDIILLKDLLHEYRIDSNKYFRNIDNMFYRDNIPHAFRCEKTYNDCINELLIPQINYKDIEQLSSIIKLIFHAEQHGINKNITLQKIHKTTQFSKAKKKETQTKNNDLFDKYFLFINENKLFNEITTKFKKHYDIISNQQYEKISWEISDLNDSLKELKALKDKNPQYYIEEDLNEAINDIDFNKIIQNANANYNENIYIETLIYQLSIINKTVSHVHQKYINLIFAQLGLELEI